LGGVWIPVDKFGLLAPYIGLASAILAATVATAIYVKLVRSRKENHVGIRVDFHCDRRHLFSRV